ncbi:CDP-alcohol phosphatidyltransferase family protein [Oleiharenicola lentus]|uniref:CDP-alcohol phosphatidyltransferase family protein n=1 Tax=Oleiharenicola lentus TaxID=2508720 RepID=UPI003F66B9AB
MPSVYDIKPTFQNLLRPITRSLAQAGVTANQVTVAAALLSAAVGACIYFNPLARWPLFLLPAFLFVRMALNAIDGMLAREHGMKSRLGAVLNEVGDVVADTALYLPFAFVPGFSPWLVVVISILAIISEMTGVVAVQIGVARRYDGPMGKSDRAFVFGLFALLVACGVPRGAWLHYALWAVLGLLVVTIWNRARRALATSPDSAGR